MIEPEKPPKPHPETLIRFSEPYLFDPSIGRLGEILVGADLVTEKQIRVALSEQEQFHDRRIGEILSARGWIDRRTADFFAERWPRVLERRSTHKLGHYLKEAALLNDNQIARILNEQEALWLRFGSIAVMKGWLKQTTLDFFLGHLYPRELTSPAERDGRTQFFPVGDRQPAERLRIIETPDEFLQVDDRRDEDIL